MSETTHQPREGTRTFGELNVSWRGHYVPAGWEVDCALQFGNAKAQLMLDRRVSHQPFKLQDGDRISWGGLQLRPDSDHALALSIDYHDSVINEDTVTLCDWKACDPCGQTSPSKGSATLGEQGWLNVEWTIGGSEHACLTVRLKISRDDDTAVDTVELSPRTPVWRKAFQRCNEQDSDHTELALVMSVSTKGIARLDAVLRHAGTPGQHVELDRFALVLHPPSPVPDAAPGHSHGVVLGQAREFASFTYPCGLQPITSDQWVRRFVTIDNTSEFQNSLRTFAGQNDHANIRACAEDFLAPDSKRYAGQYVSRMSDLPAPMNRLEGPRIRALLAIRPESSEHLQAVVTDFLGMSIDDFLALPVYSEQLARIQNSLIARLIAGIRAGSRDESLIQALQVCHVAEASGAMPHTAAASEWLQDLLEASIVISAAITPVQTSSATTPVAYVKPLGYASVQVIKQQLVGYRMGNIAHIENVMRGESKERSEEHSRRIDTGERDSHENAEAEVEEQDYQGRSEDRRESVTHPLTILKREFDDLKQQYGSDGLSVTMSGSWTDTPTGQPTLEQNAARYARRLLDRASARLARRTESERSKRSVEKFAERNRRRFDNEKGNAHLSGIYRWIDEIHAAHLEHRGNRLILEMVVAKPAADYVQRSNVLHGLDITAPIPPWQGSDAIAPVRSPTDIDRSNYAALSACYNATAMPPPPPQNLNPCATLSNDTPHAHTRLEIPAGYTATDGTISYGWTGRATDGITQTLDILVGEQAIKIDPAQDPNPGSKPLSSIQPGEGSVAVSAVTAGLDYVVHVTLACTCAPAADIYLRWQITAYHCLMAAYQARRDEYLRAMTLLAEGPAPSSTQRCRETERDELQKSGIQCLIAPFLASPAPQAWQQDALALALIPFFRDALEWEGMTYAFYGRYFASDDPDRPAWLDLAQSVENAPGFREFLEAGAARMLVPVKPHHVLPLLFYLTSGGQLWGAAGKLTPVFEVDAALANELKSLAHLPPQTIPGEAWEVEIATSMLMLQTDDRLPERSEFTEQPI